MEVFEWAHEHSIKIGVLSDTRGKHIEKAMESFHLSVDHIVGRQYRKKAKPNSFLGNMMIDGLRVIEENVLFVGNRIADAQQAKISGFDFVAALWGVADNELKDVRTITSPRDVLKEFMNDEQ